MILMVQSNKNISVIMSPDGALTLSLSPQRVERGFGMATFSSF
jgi:hypothetical protein